MKILEDALASTEFAAQWKLLKSIPAKDHPKLLKAIPEQRMLVQDFGRTLDSSLPDNARLEENYYGRLLCINAAELIACQGKQKLPKGVTIDWDLLERDEVFDFLKSVSPAWLPSFFNSLGFSRELAYRYLEDGIIPPFPDSHHYYKDLPEFIGVRAAGRMESAKEFLKAHPSLVTRDIHPTIRGRHSFRLGLMPGYFYDSRCSYFIQIPLEDGFSVLKAVAELCSEGIFDLAPILRTTLETILDIPRDSSGPFVISVHTELAPTAAQSVQVQDAYFALLASPHKSAVKFAVTAIHRFVELPGFDAEGLLSHMESVFLHGSNPLHIDALKMMAGVLKFHPGISGKIPDAVASALLNPNPKVQSALLTVLKAMPTSVYQPISDAISPLADRILPSLKKGFSLWIEESGSMEEVYDLSRSGTTVETGERLYPLQLPGDLAFIANELLVRNADPMKLELFLDGLARFAGKSPDLVEKALAPLQPRAVSIYSGKERKGYSYSEVPGWAARLIIQFGPDPSLTGSDNFDLSPFPDTSTWPLDSWDSIYYGATNFVYCRLIELWQGTRAGREAPLFSTPEYSLGFIDAQTLVERLGFIVEQGIPPLHFDFILGIARCRLAGVDASSLVLPESGDEASRVLRFLFTGEVLGAIETPAWWLAAARTREPLGDFSKHPLFSRYHREDEPDLCKPAEYRGLLGVYVDDEGELGEDSGIEEIPIPPNHLYSLQHRGGGFWRYSFTPGFLDAVVAKDMIISCYLSLGNFKGSFDKVRAMAVMAELGMRRLPIRHTMQVHLLVALNSPGAAEREAAVDLIIQASGDGRLSEAIPGLGNVFSQLLRGKEEPSHGLPNSSRAHQFYIMYGAIPESAEQGFLNLSRLVPALRRLSAGDLLLKRQLRDILLTGLEKPPGKQPKGFPGLLEILLDLLMESPPARPFDLNATWGAVLEGKAMALATRISKIHQSSPS